MTGFLNELFNFYIEQRGWLIFLVVPSVIFILMLIDNNNKDNGAIGWLIGIFICLLVFIPAAIYDLGSAETRSALSNDRQTIFIVGMLGAIVPVFIAGGYLLSNRVNVADDTHRSGSERSPYAESPIGGGNQFGNSQPVDHIDDESETKFDSPFDSPDFNPDPPGALRQAVPPTVYESNNAPARQTPATKPENLVNAWLVDMTDAKQRYQLKKGSTVIGRGGNHDINLSDKAVSREGHARVAFTKGVFILRDMGSSNGTKLNGFNVDQDQQLENGDQIVLGDTELQFIIGESPKG